MKTIHLTPSPINRDAFAPYGNIIALQDDIELSAVSVIKDNANTAVKVIRANQYNTQVPIPFFESHPLSTQAFIPMNGGQFFVIVAEATREDTFDIDTIKCFVTDGTQGIQYNSGVWHTPFCALDANKNFVVLDRHPNTNDESTINIKFAKFKNTEIFVKI